MFRLMCLFTLLASCSAALPERAAASARQLRDALELRPGAACVSRDTLIAQIAAWLGKETIDGDLAIVVIGNAQDAQDVSFELRRGATVLANRRFFPAPSRCGPLEATLALAIAMALEVSLRDELMASLASAARRLGVRISVAALAELGLGLLPSASAGGALRVGVRLHPRAALRLDALMHKAAEGQLDGPRGALDFDAWLVAARLAVCLPVALARALVANACAGLGAYGAQIIGNGYRGAHSAWLFYIDLLVGMELSVVVSKHWSIDAGGNFELPQGERRFGVSNPDGTLAASRRLPRVAGSLRAGAAYHF